VLGRIHAAVAGPRRRRRRKGSAGAFCRSNPLTAAARLGPAATRLACQLPALILLAHGLLQGDALGDDALLLGRQCPPLHVPKQVLRPGQRGVGGKGSGVNSQWQCGTGWGKLGGAPAGRGASATHLWVAIWSPCSISSRMLGPSPAAPMGAAMSTAGPRRASRVLHDDVSSGSTLSTSTNAAMTVAMSLKPLCATPLVPTRARASSAAAPVAARRLSSVAGVCGGSSAVAPASNRSSHRAVSASRRTVCMAASSAVADSGLSKMDASRWVSSGVPHALVSQCRALTFAGWVH
jgi:hypothetical protein